MNISTYEARIKALEDQLNPPAPGGSTGLLSVVVTPDITLSDGTSLNAKLAEMMPIEGTSDGVPQIRTITALPETPPESGTEYSFVVTPASGDTAGYKVGTTQTLSNEKGAPLSGSASVENGAFSMNVFSFNGTKEDDGKVFPNRTVSVNIFVGNIK